MGRGVGIIFVLDPFLFPSDGQSNDTNSSPSLSMQLHIKSKKKDAPDIPAAVEKSITSSLLEAATEYSRIVFDLFPAGSRDIQIPADQPPHRIGFIFPKPSKAEKVPRSGPSHNDPDFQWLGTPQNTRSLLKWISDESIGRESAQLLQSLDRAAEFIATSAVKAEEYLATKRVMCLQFHSPSPHRLAPFVVQTQADASTEALEEGQMGPPSGYTHILQYFSNALQKAVDSRRPQRKRSRKRRNMDGSEVTEVAPAVDEEPRGPERIELVLLQVYTHPWEAEEQLYFTERVGDIHGTMYKVQAQELVPAIQKLACIDFQLSTLRITEIPMKAGSENDKSRIIYDVLLLHRTKVPISLKNQAGRISLGDMPVHETTLQWKADKSLNRSALTCKSIERLTPVSIYSSPTQCLTRYLIGQKPVTLVRVREGQPEEQITHMILQQGQQMYLHELNASFQFPAPEKGMQRFFDFYSHSDSNMRVGAFEELIDASLLVVPGMNASKKRKRASEKSEFVTFCPTGDRSENITTCGRLVEGTMWFPYHTKSTILCQPQASGELNQMLNTIYRALVSRSPLSTSEENTGVTMLQKLYKGFQINDSSFFPGTSQQNRTQVYQMLWTELLSLSRRSTQLNKERRPSALSQFIEEVFKEPSNSNSDSTQVLMNEGDTKMGADDKMQIDPPKFTPAPRSTSPVRTGFNSGDLTHTGSSLEQERKRRKFPMRPDPLDYADTQSLFSLYWKDKLDKIPPEKNVL